jgi:hypothetical protein
MMNSGIQGSRIRKSLNPIIPQFLNFTQYSILPPFPVCRQAGIIPFANE